MQIAKVLHGVNLYVKEKALFKNLVVQRPQLSKVQDFGFLLDKHVP